MFVSKQIFAGSWRRYFIGKLSDVTKEGNSYLVFYKLRIESSFMPLGKVTLLSLDASYIWVIFLVSTSMRPVIAVKWLVSISFEIWLWNPKNMSTTQRLNLV